jgi:outer membrane protein insertion porin family/translocation and assembly module TamA
MSRSLFASDSLVALVLVAAIAVLGGCKTIPEGRSAVNEVQIRGTDQLDDGDVKDKIATTESPKLLMLFRGILFEYSLFDRFVLQRDLARVEAFYRSKGYYDVHARAGRVHQLDDSHVRVEVIVEEGPPAVVKTVHVDGLDGVPAPIAEAARRAAALGLRLDMPFAEEDFKKAEADVRRALTDHGYAYAKVESDAAVDIVRHAVDVVIAVKPGMPCVFGEVRIDGLGSLPDKQIRRTIDITPGTPYSEKELEDAQQALLDLGVLASVELTPELPDPPESPVVPVHVKLELARLRTLKLGGGIEFDALKTNLHGLIGWEDRNFFGGLRTFSVQFRPGVVFYPLRVNNLVAPTKFLPEERLRFELAQPSFLEARLRAILRPELNVYPVLINPNPLPDERVIGYTEVRNAIGVERAIWKFFGSLTHNTQVAYPFAYVNAKDPTLGLVVISYPELYTTFDFRDDKIHPTRGLFLGNSLQVAGQIFGGDANDFKIQPEARAYLPLYRKKVVLATRVSAGLLESQNYGKVVHDGPNNGVVPASADRTKDYQLTFFRGFFSGGPNQNRGYPIRGVGPYDIVPFLTPAIEAGKVNAECASVTGVVADRCRTPTGGFTLWEGSVEVRYAVAGPLSIATFCDASDVSPQTNDFRFDHLHLSCGAGGRYDTPAGPIRLDIGYRLPGLQVLGGLTPDERAPDTLLGIPIAVHIGIGEAY